MTNSCPYCGRSLDNLSGSQIGGHVGACPKNPKRALVHVKLKQTQEYDVACSVCNKLFVVRTTQHRFDSGDYTKHCSRKCANGRIMSSDVKKKIQDSIHNYMSMYTSPFQKAHPLHTCETCGIEFIADCQVRRFCDECLKDERIREGQASASSQGEKRRSRNEVEFAKLCMTKWPDTLTNARVFNGWDADVMIPSLKVAVLWNGVWHYKKIASRHSVLQVQNRDLIKLHEIESHGYKAYVIKDLGKFNPEFVQGEFEKFLLYVSSLT